MQLNQLQASINKVNQRLDKEAITSKTDLTSGRIRLGQFNVIGTDNSGVATAHAPNGNRISLREGESVYIGPERLMVKRVFPEQDVVHIGDKWFIDIRRENIGPEERTLRRELSAVAIEPKDDRFVSVGDGPGQLHYSDDYEILANIDHKVVLLNCKNHEQRIYKLSDVIPNHGRIRSIRGQEVVTDRSVFTYDACVTSGG